MKNLFLSFFLLLTISAFSQGASNTWATLGKITFKKEFDAALGFKIDKPVFSDDIKACLLYTSRCV